VARDDSPLRLVPVGSHFQTLALVDAMEPPNLNRKYTDEEKNQLIANLDIEGPCLITQIKNL
jgi:hypothetical protein